MNAKADKGTLERTLALLAAAVWHENGGVVDPPPERIPNTLDLAKAVYEVGREVGVDKLIQGAIGHPNSLGVCPRNNVLNDMRHWWSVKMLITPLQSPECCKQVIVWRFSSPGTNTRTGS